MKIKTQSVQHVRSYPTELDRYPVPSPLLRDILDSYTDQSPDLQPDTGHLGEDLIIIQDPHPTPPTPHAPAAFRSRYYWDYAWP
jgi:hypothetical protein